MHTAKALAVSLVAAAMVGTLPSRAFVAPSSVPSGAGIYLAASAPAPEPRDFVLLVMSLAAVALTGRRSK